MYYIFIAAAFGELSRKIVMLVIHDVINDVFLCDTGLTFKLITN